MIRTGSRLPGKDCHVVPECIGTYGGMWYATGAFYKSKVHNDMCFDLVNVRYAVLSEYIGGKGIDKQ